MLRPFQLITYFSCLTLWCCTGVKTETVPAADSVGSDTVQEVMTSVDEEEPEELEDFNESDYGDPGLEGTKKTFGELQDHVQQFLTNLLNKKVDSIVDERFFNLSPGPGVLGFISEGKSSEFLSHPDVASLLSGTSTEAFLESIYTQEFLRCDSESLPDGVYVNTSYVDPLDESVYSTRRLKS